MFLKHLLIWAWVYGEYPHGDIDHEDHDRGNDRLLNLKDVTPEQNMKNKSKYKGRDLPTGVYKRGERFLASIRSNGRLQHLGYFYSQSDAAEARAQAQIKHNFHPNHGTTQ